MVQNFSLIPHVICAMYMLLKYQCEFALFESHNSIIHCRINSRNAFNIVKYLHNKFLINTIRRDIVMDHMTGPSAVYLDKTSFYAKPFLSTMVALKERVQEMYTGSDFEWYQGDEDERMQGGEARADLVYIIRMDWMYAMVKATHLHKKVRKRAGNF